MTIKWTVFWPQCIWTSRFAEEMFVLKPPSKSEVQTIDIDFIQSRLWLSYQPVIISVCFRKHCLELAETVKNQHETRDRSQDDSLFCKSCPEVHHGLHQLLLADGAVVVVVEDPEGRLDVVHLVTALSEQLDTNFYKVVPRHHSLPVTVGLKHGDSH